MAQITGYTAARMKQIEDETVVSGRVSGGTNLMLTTRAGVDIDAGYVKGDKGDTGPVAPIVAGIVTPYGGSVPPTGWLVCNGAQVSRTTYPDLFAAIGTKYGNGDGNTTFNLPDLRGRVAVGFDAGQAEFNTIGVIGGEKAHILTVNEMPSHTHTVKGFAGLDDSNFSGNQGAYQAADSVTPTYNNPTESTGGDQAHNNLQPYAVTNYIISIGTAGNLGGGTPIVNNAMGQGTTAARDAAFGIPSTDMQKVALANKLQYWYNLDNGMIQIYQATTGTSGLTVPGVSGAAGWYTVPYFEKLPKGISAFVEMTSIGPYSTVMQVVLSIPSFTFKANRWYEIEWTHGITNATGASTLPLAQLFSASTADAASATTGLTELAGWNVNTAVNNQTARINPKRKIKFNTDTTLQIKATINGNGQNCAAASGPTYPGQLTIEDLGMQI